MRSYRITPRAARDLAGIEEHVAERSARRALRLMQRLTRVFCKLGAMPGMGRAREEFGPGLRSFAVGSYLVFYVPTEGGVDIARVAHGARNLPDLF